MVNAKYNKEENNMGRISESVEKQVVETAKKMIESGLDIDNFQFGRSEKSRIWISTDPEKISGISFIVVQDKRFYFGILRMEV